MPLVKSIKKIGKADTYNMEVEDVHNFSVNGGIIVHNSIDSARYLLMSLKERKTKEPKTLAEKKLQDYLEAKKVSQTWHERRKGKRHRIRGVTDRT